MHFLTIIAFNPLADMAISIQTRSLKSIRIVTIMTTDEFSPYQNNFFRLALYEKFKETSIVT